MHRDDRGGDGGGQSCKARLAPDEGARAGEARVNVAAWSSSSIGGLATQGGERRCGSWLATVGVAMVRSLQPEGRGAVEVGNDEPGLNQRWHGGGCSTAWRLGRSGSGR